MELFIIHNPKHIAPELKEDAYIGTRVDYYSSELLVHLIFLFLYSVLVFFCLFQQFRFESELHILIRTRDDKESSFDDFVLGESRWHLMQRDVSDLMERNKASNK